MTLRSLLLPDPIRRLPYARAWNVSARTVHLAATGTLLGGHVFGVAPTLLLPWLWVAILSGGLLMAIEAYSTLDWLFQIGGVAVVVKVALLCVIPFAWGMRVPMLFAVVVIAGISAHMPGRYRHYSLLYRRSMRSVSK